MVSQAKYLRYVFAPLFGCAALAMMFLKMPEMQIGCKTCQAQDPYIPLIGSAYFSALIALSLLFPSFPPRPLAKSGLIFALLLFFALAYLRLPGACAACLIAHFCHIAIWTIWLSAETPENRPVSPLGTRVCLLLFAPIAAAALFSSLNLTFRSYRSHGQILAMNPGPGDRVPPFYARTLHGREIGAKAKEKYVLNFVASDRPYCDEQLKILSGLEGSFSCPVFNIPSKIPSSREDIPGIEWIEDRGEELQRLFQVKGYPTMVIVGKDQKIFRVIQGVSDGLKSDLELSLTKKHIAFPKAPLYNSMGFQGGVLCKSKKWV